MYYCIECVSEFIASGSLFWWCAIIGSGMFVLRFVTGIFGGGDHSDLDAGDAALDGSDPSGVHDVKWLSLQTITGFLMIFGWTGITCKQEFGMQDAATICISIVIGLLTAVILRVVLKYAYKLHSSGNVYTIQDAIGKEAYVYQAIPKDGVGKISISLHDMTREIDAVTHDGKELASFTHVKIIKQKDNNTLVVEPL